MTNNDRLTRPYVHIERIIGDSPRDEFLRKYISPNVSSLLVYNAFAAVNRVHFVPEECREHAWSNKIMPLDEATISEPSLVARMIDALNPDGKGKILEIGTGSGLTAAYLSGCSRTVYTVEANSNLGSSAKQRLKKLGYDNVTVKLGNGALGHPKKDPFDGIIVTGSMRSIPQTFVRQLKDGGRIVIPVGKDHWEESILIQGVKKDESLITRPLGGVSFMPIRSDSEGGWTLESAKQAESLRKERIEIFIQDYADKIGKTVSHLQDEVREVIKKRYNMNASDEIPVEVINGLLVEYIRSFKL